MDEVLSNECTNFLKTKSLGQLVLQALILALYNESQMECYIV